MLGACSPSKGGSDDNKLMMTIYAFLMISCRTQPHVIADASSVRCPRDLAWFEVELIMPNLLKYDAQLPNQIWSFGGDKDQPDACQSASLRTHAYITQPFLPLPELPLEIEPNMQRNHAWDQWRRRLLVKLTRTLDNKLFKTVFHRVNDVETTFMRRSQVRST